VEFPEFVKKASIEALEYVTDIDYNNEKIHIYFEDGSRSDFEFDEWFHIFEAAMHIVSINSSLSEK